MFFVLGSTIATLGDFDLPGLYVWQVNNGCTLLTFSCLFSQQNLQNVPHTMQ